MSSSLTLEVGFLGASARGQPRPAHPSTVRALIWPFPTTITTGCRPITEDARHTMNASRVALSALRDGDWRPQQEEKDAAVAEEEGAKADAEADDGWQEDTRIEGTIAYLPPEVIAGNRPTPKLPIGHRLPPKRGAGCEGDPVRPERACTHEGGLFELLHLSADSVLASAKGRPRRVA